MRITLRARMTFFASLLALGLMPPLGQTFNEPGHLESIRLIVEKSLQVPPHLATVAVYPLQSSERELVEFCAQLPDLSQELDAARTYTRAVGQWSLPVSWIAWGWFNHPMTDEYRRMIAVQQTLHALTGGNALAMRRVAIASAGTFLQQAVKASPETADRTVPLCALGMALHLYGDTFAHRQMAWDTGKQGDQLYPTGRGHAFDGHYPDYILCNHFTKDSAGNTDCHQSTPAAPAGMRFPEWILYWTRAQPAINDPAHPRTPWSGIAADPIFLSSPNLLLPKIQQAVLSVAGGAKALAPSDADIAVGGKIRETLNLDLGGVGSPWPQAVDKVVTSAQGSLLSAPGCRRVLHDGAVALNVARGAVLGPKNCETLWLLYYSTVIPLLIDCETARNLDLPECTANQRPIDDSWADWLKGSPPDLERFAGTLVFN